MTREINIVKTPEGEKILRKIVPGFRFLNNWSSFNFHDEHVININGTVFFTEIVRHNKNTDFFDVIAYENGVLKLASCNSIPTWR